MHWNCCIICFWCWLTGLKQTYTRPRTYTHTRALAHTHIRASTRARTHTHTHARARARYSFPTSHPLKKNINSNKQQQQPPPPSQPNQTKTYHLPSRFTTAAITMRAPSFPCFEATRGNAAMVTDYANKSPKSSLF